MEFSIWVVEEEGAVYVFREANEALKEAFGEALVEHRVALKEPVQARYADDQERLMWVSSPMGGLIRDEGLRRGAFVAAFVEHWSFAGGVSLASFQALHPVIAEAVYEEAYRRVYPSPLASRAWQTYAARLTNGEENPSGPAG